MIYLLDDAICISDPELSITRENDERKQLFREIIKIKSNKVWIDSAALVKSS